VRLGAQGFHSRHTHVKGWISSALYVELPPAAAMGPPPSGWLEFGAPPPELNLDLAAYSQIEPVAGRLVLFPSHLWHGTVPFADGERLTVAFDVRRPRN
jgi:Putative 2OG-Fe(II) oxygenase